MLNCVKYVITEVFTTLKSVFNRCTFGYNYSTESLWVGLDATTILLSSQLCQAAQGLGMNCPFHVQQ